MHIFQKISYLAVLLFAAFEYIACHLVHGQTILDRCRGSREGLEEILPRALMSRDVRPKFGYAGIGVEDVRRSAEKASRGMMEEKNNYATLKKKEDMASTSSSIRIAQGTSSATASISSTGEEVIDQEDEEQEHALFFDGKEELQQFTDLGLESENWSNLFSNVFQLTKREKLLKRKDLEDVESGEGDRDYDGDRGGERRAEHSRTEDAGDGGDGGNGGVRGGRVKKGRKSCMIIKNFVFFHSVKW